MKKLIYLIIFLLILQLAYAEQYTLIQGQTLDYKGIKITLNSVGSSGSLNININDLTRLLEENNPVEAYGITIELIESSLQSATIGITQTGGCLIDEDCDDNKACTRDICQHGFCASVIESGCILNDECKDHLTLGEIDNVLSYCGRDNNWHPRKEVGEECFNNAECLSNLCEKNICKSLEETKMAPSWILIILGIIFCIEGIFVLASPKRAKNILKNLIYNFSDKTWQIFFFIELLIGGALIIWALT